MMSKDTNDATTVSEITSNLDLAHLAIHVAQASQADAIICVTESGELAQHLHGLSDQFPLVAATTNGATYDALTRAGIETVRLPLRAADRYRQVGHAISVALRSTKVSVGDLVVCAIGRGFYRKESTLVVLADVDPDVEALAISDLLKLTDAIRAKVLEAAITVACKIGRAARRGNRVGSIFMLGDSLEVLERSKPLIPNPFHGHDESTRQLTNPDVHSALVELAKLDGAFVVRGDGFIQAAGVFLTPSDVDVELHAGLGTRHAAAAAITARTEATAIVISATDGNVRVFSGGEMVLQVDPEVVHEFLRHSDIRHSSHL